MAILNEPRHPGSAILSEASGARSRDAIIVAAGSGKFEPNTVLGKFKSGAASSAAKGGGNTGNGTLTLDVTTPVLGTAKNGVYTVRCIAAAANNGTFRIEGPDGVPIGDVVMAAGAGAWNEQIKFALADGATDFVVGDGFDITVTLNAAKYKPSPATATDGTDQACAVAIYGGDATSADVRIAAITVDAEMIIDELVYDASVNDATKRGIKILQLRDNANIRAR